jgi:hypothetical protein
MRRHRSIVPVLLRFYNRQKALDRRVVGDPFWKLLVRTSYGRRVSRRVRQNYAWRTAYTMASAGRLVRSMTKRRPQQLRIGKLRPGEVVQVEVIDPRSAAASGR